MSDNLKDDVQTLWVQFAAVSGALQIALGDLVAEKGPAYLDEFMRRAQSMLANPSNHRSFSTRGYLDAAVAESVQMYKSMEHGAKAVRDVVDIVRGDGAPRE